MPTILDIVVIEPPGTFEGVDQMPIDGASVLPTFEDPDAAAPRDVQYFEIAGLRAIQSGKYRAIAQHKQGDDYAHDRWRLYDTTVDPSEVRDLSTQYPHRTRELEKLWWREAEANSVLPLDDRRMSEILGQQTPGTQLTKDRYILRPQQSRLNVYGNLCGTNRSMRFTTKLTGAHREGIIVASGGGAGGYVLYILDDRVVFEHHHGETSVKVQATSELPGGDVQLAAELLREASGPGANIQLVVNGDVVATGRVPNVGVRLSYRGLEIGRDTTPHVSNAYRDRGDFAMPHSVFNHVVLEFLEPTRTLENAHLEERSQ
jgi:arylsulfatase